MLNRSHSPFTNCRSGEPSPGTAVDLYELVRSKLYSVGLNRTLMTFPFIAPSSTVIAAFLSCGFMSRSHSSPLALDARAPLDPANNVVGESVHHPRIQLGDWGGRRRRVDDPQIGKDN